MSRLFQWFLINTRKENLMKKYTTLPNADYTSLVAETVSYLNSNFDVEDEQHKAVVYRWLGHTNELTAIPSLGTTFTDDSLTVDGVGHLTINQNSMHINAHDVNMLFVPVMDYAECVLKLYDVAPGATKETRLIELKLLV